MIHAGAANIGDAGISGATGATAQTSRPRRNRRYDTETSRDDPCWPRGTSSNKRLLISHLSVVHRYPRPGPGVARGLLRILQRQEQVRPPRGQPHWQQARTTLEGRSKAVSEPADHAATSPPFTSTARGRSLPRTRSATRARVLGQAAGRSSAARASASSPGSPSWRASGSGPNGPSPSAHWSPRPSDTPRPRSFTRATGRGSSRRKEYP